MEDSAVLLNSNRSGIKPTEFFAALNANAFSDYSSRKSLIEIFEEQVVSTPDAIAVVENDNCISYDLLNRRANQLAYYLQKQGITAEELISVYLPAGMDFIIAILAILKSGCAYIPLDVNFPVDRIQFMLEDTQSPFIITSISQSRLIGQYGKRNLILLDELSDTIHKEPDTNVLLTSHSDSLAYIMYTSGSTGKPKGILVEHQNIIRLVKNTNFINVSAQDCIAQIANVGFDASTFEIWAALLNGASMVICSNQDIVLNVQQFSNFLQKNQISILFLTTALFHNFAQTRPEIFADLKYLLFGGERCSTLLVNKVLIANTSPHFKLIHVYGPTENTVFSTYYPVVYPLKENEAVPIGKPIANTSCYVVNTQQKLVKIGQIGELYLGGIGIARGYLGRSELTETRFIKDIFTTSKSQGRCYRTGDLVKLLADGNLEFIGRTDDQVKIRGFRIELGEIENTLLQHNEIAQAVILMREDANFSKQLVAYCVPKHPSNNLSLATVCEFLATKLPTYMLPTALVCLEQLPLTKNGKIDKKSLPEPHWNIITDKAENADSLTEMEKITLRTIARVLNRPLEAISINHNFFELGGHSLSAMQVAQQFSDDLNKSVTVNLVMRAPNLKLLAAELLVCEPLRLESKSNSNDLSCADYPLSFAQEQIWLHQQLNPEMPFYNEPLNISLPEAIDITVLTTTLKQVLYKHTAFRTIFIETTQGLRQKVLTDFPFNMDFVDLSNYELGEAKTLAYEEAAKQAKMPFNLAYLPLIRFMLVKYSSNQFQLFIVAHHIIIDGVTMFNNFLPEVENTYRKLLIIKDTDNVFPVIDLDCYQLHAVEERRNFVDKQTNSISLAYWLDKLKNFERVQFPIDKSTAEDDFAGKRECFALSDLTSQAVHRLAKANKTSPFVVLFTAFNILLAKYTRANCFTTATVIAGNNVLTDNKIGNYLNTLPLQVKIKQSISIKNCIEQIKDELLDSMMHAHIPLQQMTKHIHENNALHTHMPFSMAFILEPVHHYTEQSASNWKMSQLEIHTDTSKFDLTFELDEHPDYFFGRVEYKTNLFSEVFIKQIIQHYIHMLEECVGKPLDTLITDIQLLTQEEQQVILKHLVGSKTTYPSSMQLIDLFHQQVDKNPNQIAIIEYGEQLTYQELAAKSTQLACYLIKNYQTILEQSSIIGIFVNSRLAFLIGLLATLKINKSYVAIDPNYPQDRIKYVIKDAGVKLLLTETAGSLRSFEFEKDSYAVISINNVPPSNFKGDIAVNEKFFLEEENNPVAMVIYTSGTTGKPKGVLIAHKNISRIIVQNRELPINANDIIAATVSIGFDASAYEIWLALANGATLVSFRKEDILDSVLFSDLLVAHKITTLFLTTQLFHNLAFKAPEIFHNLKYLMVGGEKLNVEAVNQIIDCNLGAPKYFYNLCGPTENGVYSTIYKISHQDRRRRSIPIGSIANNTYGHIVDKGFNIVPIGVPGELVVGGDGIAEGYLNQSKLTKEKFINDPFVPENKLYRTGDMVYLNENLEIEYLGREDNQVKIRGYRIELNEIETNLLELAEVGNAVVDISNSEEAKQLIAFVIPKDFPANHHKERFTKNILTKLKAKLPDYMVPHYCFLYESFPLTAHGKINRRQLLTECSNAMTQVSSNAPPIKFNNSVEELLFNLWCKCLGHQNFNLEDDFFRVGGDSLLSMQLISMAKENNLQFSLAEFFKNPTICKLADIILKKTPAKNQTNIIEQVSGEVKLTQIQHWFFEQNFSNRNWWNMGIWLKCLQEIDVDRLQAGFVAVQEAHPQLRARFQLQGDIYRQIIGPVDTKVLEVVEMDHVDFTITHNEYCEKAQRNFNLQNGPLMKAVLFRVSGKKNSLLWIGIHHLLVDGVSWRIFLNDLFKSYHNRSVFAHANSISYQTWSKKLKMHANAIATTSDLARWQELAVKLQDHPLLSDKTTLPPLSAYSLIKRDSAALYESLIENNLCRGLNISINEILLAALVKTLAVWKTSSSAYINLESHGRQLLGEEIDVANTIGWFTAIYPVLFNYSMESDPTNFIKDIKQQLEQALQFNINFSLLRYLSDDIAVIEQMKKLPMPAINFNYLGVVNNVFTDESFAFVDFMRDEMVDKSNNGTSLIDINICVADNAFKFSFGYSAKHFAQKEIQKLIEIYFNNLNEFITALGQTAAEKLLSEKNYGKVPSSIMVLKEGVGNTALFMFHAAGGSAYPYITMVDHLREDLAVYGINDPALTDAQHQFANLNTMADCYVSQILEQCHFENYILGGWSLGAKIAFEAARILRDKGKRVPFVVLADDSLCQETFDQEKFDKYIEFEKQSFLENNQLDQSKVSNKKMLEHLAYTHKLAMQYQPAYCDSHVVLIRSADEIIKDWQNNETIFDKGWRKFSRSLDIFMVNGKHHTMLNNDNGGKIAAIINSLYAVKVNVENCNKKYEYLQKLIAYCVVNNDLDCVLTALESNYWHLSSYNPLAVAEDNKQKQMKNVKAKDLSESELLEKVIDTCEKVLNIKSVHRHSNLYSYGLTSLTLIRLAGEISKSLSKELPLSIFTQTTLTVDSLVRNILYPQLPQTVVQLSNSGKNCKEKLFLIHPAGGTAFCYRALAERLEGVVDVYGIDCTNYQATSLDELADYYKEAIIESIRLSEKSHKLCIGGWSFGGNIAILIADKLEKAGYLVDKLYLIDSRPVNTKQQLAYLKHMLEDEAAMLLLIVRHLEIVYQTTIDIQYKQLVGQSSSEKLLYISQSIAHLLSMPKNIIYAFIEEFKRNFEYCVRLLLSNHNVEKAAFKTFYFQATKVPSYYEGFPALEASNKDDLSCSWEKCIGAPINIYKIDATHENIVFEPAINFIARTMLDSVST